MPEADDKYNHASTSMSYYNIINRLRLKHRYGRVRYDISDLKNTVITLITKYWAYTTNKLRLYIHKK
jgi:hypothetical protein